LASSFACTRIGRTLYGAADEEGVMSNVRARVSTCAQCCSRTDLAHANGGLGLVRKLCTIELRNELVASLGLLVVGVRHVWFAYQLETFELDMQGHSHHYYYQAYHSIDVMLYSSSLLSSSISYYRCNALFLITTIIKYIIVSM